MPTWFPRSACLVLLSVVCLIPSGCGETKILRVTGTVRYHGKPISNLIVKFIPAEGRFSTGYTNEDGHYVLRYDNRHEGALRGAHKVYLAVRPRNPAEEMALQQGKGQLSEEMKEILAKYGKETSSLHYEVITDKQVIDLDLD
jgi:hypothetical protein